MLNLSSNRYPPMSAYSTTMTESVLRQPGAGEVIGRGAPWPESIGRAATASSPARRAPLGANAEGDRLHPRTPLMAFTFGSWPTDAATIQSPLNDLW